MDNFLKKIFRPARQIKLDLEKKNSIKSAILSSMKENPLILQETSFWNLIFSPRLRPVYITISALAVILLGGGVISAQANSSLPGDTLYPVKVGFNEKVMQVLAFSDQAKTELGIQLADLRLQEAEKLAVQGKMTENTQTQIDNNFNVQANAIAKSIEKLNDAKMYDSAEKIASDFEASLKAHSRVLEKIKELKDEKASKIKDNLDSLINKVNTESQKASDSGDNSVSTMVEQSGQTISAIEKIAQARLDAAQKSIDEVKSLIESQKDKIGQDAAKQTQDNIDLAEQKIAEGKDKIQGDNKDYAGAILLFEKANMIAKESKSLIKAKNSLRINIDIKINGNNGDASEVQKKINEKIQEIRDKMPK